SMVRAKTPARTALVTDATAGAGAPPGRYGIGELEIERGADGRVVLPGTPKLAGSALTLDAAVARAVRETELPIEDVLPMASTIPAACLGASTAGRGLARTALQLSFFRFLLGAAEPANFPAGLKAVSEWFPMRERALAVGIFNAGTAVGGAFAVPVVSFIALRWGWRWAFVGTGALGFAWVLAWALFYRLPQDHPRLSPAERALIL